MCTKRSGQSRACGWMRAFTRTCSVFSTVVPPARPDRGTLNTADMLLLYSKRAFLSPPPAPPTHLDVCRTQAARQRTHGAMVGEGEAVFGHLRHEERRPELVLLLLLWHLPLL